VKPLSLRVLRLFREMGKDRLDLHALFEAAGNEPAEREGSSTRSMEHVLMEASW
jgi:hypothetical protein